jgi:hypothetical protein
MKPARSADNIQQAFKPAFFKLFQICSSLGSARTFSCKLEDAVAHAPVVHVIVHDNKMVLTARRGWRSSSVCAYGSVHPAMMVCRFAFTAAAAAAAAEVS